MRKLHDSFLLLLRRLLGAWAPPAHAVRYDGQASNDFYGLSFDLARLDVGAGMVLSPTREGTAEKPSVMGASAAF